MRCCRLGDDVGFRIPFHVISDEDRVAQVLPHLPLDLADECAAAHARVMCALCTTRLLCMLLLQAVILLDVISIPYSVKSQVNRSIQPGVVVLDPQDPTIATQPYLASKHPGQLYPFGMCPRRSRQKMPG